MNAVVTQEDRPRPSLVAGGRPMAIVPTTMDEAYRLGKAICISGMAPRGMDTPEKCMIAIMRGMEVGLTPMQSLDKIAVVNGRPTIWGDGAMALVRGSGLCEFVDESIEGEGDARVATCRAKRRDEAKPVERRFSVADAKKAGLWGKSGPWQQFPDRMQQMRARAFALRDLFADVLGGLYLREEIEDDRPQAAGNDYQGPSAPPAEVAAQVERREAPAEAPAAPPEEIQEAEFSESAVQASPPVEEAAAPFDFQTWIEDEVRPLFVQAKTAEEVEQVFDVFSDTANDLPREQRNTFEALHEQHLARVQVKPAPEQAETTGEPGPAPDEDDGFPGDEYIRAPMKEPTKGSLWERACEDLIEKSDRTAKDLGQGWTILLKQGNALAAEGEVSQEDVAGWHKRMMDEYVRLGGKPTGKTKGAAEKKAETKPAEKPADDTVGMNADEFMEHLRTRLDTLTTVDAANEFWDSTLGARNRYLESEPALGGAFRAILQKRRTQIVAQG